MKTLNEYQNKAKEYLLDPALLEPFVDGVKYCALGIKRRPEK